MRLSRRDDQGTAMPRILISGATGFIGSHLLRGLPPQYDVVVLGRHQPENGSRVEWIEQDLAEPLIYDRLPGPGQLDAIIHLAQSQVYKEFPVRAKDIFEVNVNGTFRLLEYAREVGISQFVFASSGGVYKFSHRPIVETDPIQPLSFYLSSKYAAELLMRNYEQFFHTAILRFFFVFGPGQQPGMLVPSFYRKISNGEPITIEGNPGLRINPIFVSDAVRAIQAALQVSTSGHFNVAGQDTVTITKLAELIAEVSGKDAPIQHTSSDPGGDLVADTTRMKDILCISPSVPLLEGLRQALER
jgi:UDP-glucose 4-epimerase